VLEVREMADVWWGTQVSEEQYTQSRTRIDSLDLSRPACQMDSAMNANRVRLTSSIDAVSFV